MGLVTKQYMIIIAVAICIDLPRYFELKLIKHNNSYVYLSQTSLHDNSTYQLVFKTIFVMTLRLLLPIILIVIFTSALGHAIFKTRRKIAALARKRISVGGPSISSNSTNGLQFTKRTTAHRDRLTVFVHNYSSLDSILSDTRNGRFCLPSVFQGIYASMSKHLRRFGRDWRNFFGFKLSNELLYLLSNSGNIQKRCLEFAENQKKPCHTTYL